MIAIDIWTDDENVDEEDEDNDDDEVGNNLYDNDDDYQMFLFHFEVILIDMWTEKTFILQHRCTQAHHVDELEKISITLCFIHKKSKI